MEPIPTPESSFTDEPPTLVSTMQGRSARLVANWAKCLPGQRLMIERLAEKLATMPRRKL